MDVEIAKLRSRGIASHAPFVGLIAMHFNAAEHAYQALIAAALDLSPKSAAALAAQAGTQALADMLKAAARREGDSEAGFALAYAVRLFDTCRANRNLIVHGIFANPQGRWREAIVMRKTTARGGMRPGEWTVSIAELEAVIVEILATADYLDALAARVSGGRTGDPWPVAPAMPKRRVDTLARAGES